MINILVVEDDIRVADFLERGLRAEGYRVQVARTGPDGLQMAQALAKQSAQQNETSIVLMDVMLPGMNGFDVCQQLRATGVALPIMMLTAMGTLEDRVTGLKLGADDYLAKPFAFEELLARIEALARRSQDFRPNVVKAQLVVADLVLDLNTMRVSRAGDLIELTSKELAVLELLMSAPGRLFSRERILANAWGANEDPLTNIVDVYIRRLRSKVDEGHSNALIHTQRGLGYRLEDTSKQQ
jgi:DNA-binding response OmpR family regulator